MSNMRFATSSLAKLLTSSVCRLLEKFEANTNPMLEYSRHARDVDGVVL